MLDGSLLGIKIVSSEFVAFIQLADFNTIEVCKPLEQEINHNQLLCYAVLQILPIGIQIEVLAFWRQIKEKFI